MMMFLLLEMPRCLSRILHVKALPSVKSAAVLVVVVVIMIAVAVVGTIPTDLLRCCETAIVFDGVVAIANVASFTAVFLVHFAVVFGFILAVTIVVVVVVVVTHSSHKLPCCVTRKPSALSSL